MIYYISDTHFRNQDIFDKCKRPFKLLDEMESTVISKWNNKVNDVDVVYVLGDVAKDDDISAIQIFNKLKGHKHLIVGNHDHLILEEIRKSKIFESPHLYNETGFKKQEVANKFIDSIKDKDAIIENVKKSKQKEKHFGISIMQERVSLLNGNIDIQSQIGSGTKVKIRIPLNKL